MIIQTELNFDKVTYGFYGPGMEGQNAFLIMEFDTEQEAHNFAIDSRSWTAIKIYPIEEEMEVENEYGIYPKLWSGFEEPISRYIIDKFLNKTTLCNIIKDARLHNGLEAQNGSRVDVTLLLSDILSIPEPIIKMLL